MTTMAEVANIRLERMVSSSKVTPVIEETLMEASKSEEQVINVSGIASDEAQDGIIIGGDEFSGERNPEDWWLPITESRNGGTLKAVFHLLCSGIGYQALLLPIAFVSLGWYWGVICLSVGFSWQLYTTWLLVNLHESTPPNGIRYSRYLHLSVVAFGEKWGKLLGVFPTMYLSTGTCIVYVITGGTLMELFFESTCGNSIAKTNLTGAEWFLVFICIAIFTAHFFPNLNSLAAVSAMGSIMAVFYCCLLWILSVDKGRVRDPTDAGKMDDDGSVFRNVLNGFGNIALAFRGHNLILEIQVYSSLGILTSFTNFHQKTTSKYLTGALCLTAIIHYLCAFQLYAMPAFDNFESLYTAKKNKPCPKWLRSAIRVFFGGFTYFVAVALPFLPSLGLFIGSMALPLTLAHPCLMWVVIKKPVRFSIMWCLNAGLGFSGIAFCVVCGGGALWSLIIDGLDANFFKPK